MTGQEIVGLVAVVGVMVALITMTVYIGQYHLRKNYGRSWERRALLTLQEDVRALKTHGQHEHGNRI